MKISFICRGTTNNFHMTSHLASLWNRGLDNSQTAYSPIYAQRSEDWVGFVSKCIMELIERRYHFFGSVHTYLEIFENTDFLLRFWKNTRPHGAYLNRLRSSTRKRSRNGNLQGTETTSPRFQKTPLWELFSKTCVFGARKRPLRVDRTLKWIRVDGALD